MRERTYAILGTGALGGFYGARLARAGVDVHFLLHSDYEHVRQHGLVVKSKDGDFTLPKVNAYRDARDMPRCDVVGIALKTTHNHLLADMLPHVVKDSGVVLVMQNGLEIEDAIAKIVGPHRVIGCISFLCSNKTGPGFIHHLDYGAIKIGEHSPDGTPRGITERMREIASDFGKAGIHVSFAEDLIAARWEKLVWNIPYNGLSVVLNARTDELMNHPDSRKLVEQLMREVVADAAACGKSLRDDLIPTMLEHTDAMAPYYPSMKLDYDARKPMEVEAIFGNPLRAAERAGAKSPRLEMLYQQLKFWDGKNRRSDL
jgi:2-dehydropantoate 2-reductase